MKAIDFIEKVKSGEIDLVENTGRVLEELRKINSEYSYLNIISDELALKQAKELKKNPKGKLIGVPLSVKDSICVKDVESSAGSRILKGYKPLFNATSVQNSINEGGIIVGKTSQDEFGFGGFSVNMGLGFKTPLNPFDKTRATGGSSGGAAGLAQKSTKTHISFGESTGGSIVTPASFCGVFGLCPTYGAVSRYGLIDYANSLDKVGPISKYIEDVALLLDIISKHDKRDSTSLDTKRDNYSSFLDKEIKGLKIGVVKEAFGNGVNKDIKENVWNAIKKLESDGAEYEEVSLPISYNYGIPTYYVISTSEASTNLAKFCGMRYGKHEKLEGTFNEYFSKVRSNNFGKEAKRRILLGTFTRMAGYRDAYYIQALKVRSKIIEEYKKSFKKFDVLVTPATPVLPLKFDEIDKLSIVENYMTDVLTVGPNLAGMPHINIPTGFNKNLPIGMLLTSNHLEEGKLIQLGKEFS